MKRTIAAIALVALALTGCGVDEQGNKRMDGLKENRVNLTDGRTVTCVVYRGGYAGGLSCDWEGAK